MGRPSGDALRQIWMADTKANAQKAFGHFLATNRDKYLAAAECLKKDREKLLTFYDFPQAIGGILAPPTRLKVSLPLQARILQFQFTDALL